MDVYLRMCGSGRIQGYDHSKGAWIDAGKPAFLEPAGTLANQLLGL